MNIVPKFRKQRKEDKRMEYTFDKRCSDCKYFKDGKCIHPHSMYCQHCELWTPNWYKDMRKEDEWK